MQPLGTKQQLASGNNISQCGYHNSLTLDNSLTTNTSQSLVDLRTQLFYQYSNLLSLSLKILPRKTVLRRFSLCILNNKHKKLSITHRYKSQASRHCTENLQKLFTLCNLRVNGKQKVFLKSNFGHFTAVPSHSCKVFT